MISPTFFSIVSCSLCFWPIPALWGFVFALPHAMRFCFCFSRVGVSGWLVLLLPSFCCFCCGPILWVFVVFLCWFLGVGCLLVELSFGLFALGG